MTPENRELFVAHARSAAPHEACGLVVIVRGREVYVPCRNLARSTDHFVLDPFDYAKAEDMGQVVGVVHSHPAGPHTPSQADRVACEASGLPWFILGLPTLAWSDIRPSGYVAPLVGREWAHGVLDCYAIIRDYYRQERAIELPDFHREEGWWKAGGNLYLDNFEKAGFSAVSPETLREHDVILMQLRANVPNHGAVYVGGNLILQHYANRLSSRDIYGEFYRRHTVKVLRYVGGTSDGNSGGRTRP